MKERKEIAGVPRNVFFLGLVSFFNDFSNEMVQSVMPVFLTTVLGAPAFLVGVLEGVADALASVLKLFSGWFSDKIGKRKVLAVSGYVLSVGVRSLLALVTSFTQVFGLRVVDRIGKGLRDAPRDALIAESAARERLGHAFGFHRAMDTLGATFGPLAAFFLLPMLGGSYSTFFLIAFGVGVLAIASFVWVRDSAAIRQAHGVEQSRNTSSLPAAEAPTRTPPLRWSLFKEHRSFARVVGALFVCGMGALPLVLVLLKVREVGLSPEATPLFYFLYSIAFVLTAVPLGRLGDKIGARAVIAGGFFLATLAYLGLVGGGTWLHLAASLVALGIAAAATDGLQRAIAAKRLAPQLLATGQGFLNMALGFASLAAGAIGGAIWTVAGSGAAFLYAGVLSLAGLMLFLFFTKASHD